MDAFYYLAHIALRVRLQRENGLLEELLADKAKRKEWLYTAGFETAELAGLRPTEQHAEILASFCLVFDATIAGRPALVVDTPNADKTTHCYFVAAFRAADGAVRYYNLEHSHTAGEAALCGWSEGAHSLYEFIPIPQGPSWDQVAAFAAAIEPIEQRRAQREAAPLH